MPWLRTTLLSLTTLSFLRTTQSWTLTWEDENGASVIEPGKWNDLAHPCKEINHPEGAYFEFDSDGDPVTIYLYGNRNCSGAAAGQASSYLDGNASQPILSYEVVDDSASTTTTVTLTTSKTSKETPTPTTTSRSDSGSASDSDSTPTVSPTPPSSNTNSGSDSSLSGGAIAGIVIGVVAGLALIAAVIFFLWRRRKQAPSQSQQALPMSSSSPQPPAPDTGDVSLISPTSTHDLVGASSYGYVRGLPDSPVQAPESQHQHQQEKGMMAAGPVVYAKPQPHFSELPGDMGIAELSDSHRVNELDGRGKR